MIYFASAELGFVNDVLINHGSAVWLRPMRRSKMISGTKKAAADSTTSGTKRIDARASLNIPRFTAAVRSRHRASIKERKAVGKNIRRGIANNAIRVISNRVIASNTDITRRAQARVNRKFK